MNASRFMFLLCCLLLLTACVRDYSGITRIRAGEYLITNNRPGFFETCELTEDGQGLKCRRLSFMVSKYQFYDFEGVAWVNDDLFYAVIEKRNNRCMFGCKLEQFILPFHIDQRRRVTIGSCGEMEIPLQKGDDPNCPFANCGLEGVAFNPSENLLYVAKERDRKRLFKVPLKDDFCPSGNFEQFEIGDNFSGYSDLAYSEKRKSLFVLSRSDRAFVEYSFVEKKIVLHSRDLPEAALFMDENPDVEGIFVEDDDGSLVLLAESKAFLRMKLAGGQIILPASGQASQGQKP